MNMKLVDKIIEIIMAIIPFLGGRRKRKEMIEEVESFTNLVKGQYSFLMEQLEKVLKDYFDMSARVKEMHAELFELKEQLSKALEMRCENTSCNLRNRKGGA